MKGFTLIIVAIIAGSASAGKNYYISEDKLNWHGAYQSCASRGRQLATINSCTEGLAVKKAMRGAGAANETLWISATDLGKKGDFVWMVNGKPIEYSKYGPEQPDNANNAQHCVNLQPNAENKQVFWYNGNCSEPLMYVCEDKPRICAA